VIITRLAPGETIDWHIDQMPPGIPPYFERYQIPLHVPPKVRFVVGDEALYMEPGTAWWFDNQTMHAVFNDSDEDRISMLTDIRPFKLIQSGT
jgi:aspartyl/asparaginyl beta-hydroxylase (cupin superfamily)